MLRQKSFHYNVTCVIMGGGSGTRLYPLTYNRAKPAVPLGTKFRLIDIPISNCLNSGMNRIFILTQFNSTSLHRHITSTYHFDRFSRGFVEILAAQQTPQYNVEHSWYQGTADAVRKNMVRFKEAGGDEVVILSGDQIYQMDFSEVLRTHRGTDGRGPCDVTIAALLVPRERARGFGIMKIDADANVLEFVEKPGRNAALLEGLEAPPELVRQFDVGKHARWEDHDPEDHDREDHNPKDHDRKDHNPKDRDRKDSGPFYLANMGIYIFRFDILEEALGNDFTDFGKEVLPSLLEARKVRAHLFRGYWEDIGTIRAFHRANIELAGPNPRFNFYLEDAPIYTSARLLPATKIQDATITSSLLSDGCLIEQARIEGSLIGVRSIIRQGATITNSYVMGADYYETEEDRQKHLREGLPEIGIGGGSHIQDAIIDKNARVGRNVTIRNQEEHTTFDDGRVVIREGIVIVPRGGIIPDGYSI